MYLHDYILLWSCWIMKCFSSIKIIQKIIEVELLILVRSINRWALIDQSRNLILFLKSKFQIFQMFGMMLEHPTHVLKIEI